MKCPCSKCGNETDFVIDTEDNIKCVCTSCETEYIVYWKEIKGQTFYNVG